MARAVDAKRSNRPHYEGCCRCKGRAAKGGLIAYREATMDMASLSKDGLEARVTLTANPT